MSTRTASAGRRLSASVLVALLTIGGNAYAAEPSADDRTLARTLFDEGRALAKDGKFADACPKLEESERLAPGIGTLFNLADCYEQLGRNASAWSAFSEVADLARLANQPDRETVARDRAALLKAKLVYWKLHLAGPAPQGLVLRVDGRVVSNAVLDAELPVDPGPHSVRASAPAKVEAETQVRIDGTVHSTLVELPALADPAAASEPVAPAPAPKVEPLVPAPSPEQSGREWQKPVAVVAGGVALVALGVGAAFGLKASSEWSDAKATCGNGVCDDKGFSGWESSRSSATVSTVLFTTGAVVAAAAVVLWLTAPSAGASTRAAVSPVVRWGTF